MKKALALAISACALASAFVAPAQATPAGVQASPPTTRTAVALLDDEPGPGDNYGDPKVRQLSCRNQQLVYGWDGSPFSEEDWIGLYKGKPDPADWSKNILQWKWVVSGGQPIHEFKSGQRSGQGLYTAYWTKDDDGKWAIVDEEGPENKFCN